MRSPSRLRLLAELLPQYARIAWWGIASPKLVEREDLVVHQAVILGGDEEPGSRTQVLLTVRSDLRGWELPGGNPQPGETDEQTLRREVREETGLEVEPLRHVGDYVRTGFRPHTARIHLCRPTGGELRPSAETPRVRWFDPAELPTTLFPWYRGPLADALSAASAPVERAEHQGWPWILEAFRIDLRMRLSSDEAT